MFSQYGELEDAVVTTDRASGKSKGYGFITYRFAANAAAAIAEPEKQLDVSDSNLSTLFVCPASCIYVEPAVPRGEVIPDK